MINRFLLLFVIATTSYVTCRATVLTSGDIAIIQLNTGAEEFQFVSFVPLTAGTEIFFTDNPANGMGTIGTSEGTVLYTAPPAGVAAGSVISYTGSIGNFSTTADGDMTLNDNGDNIVAYQGSLSNPTAIVYAIGESAALVGTLPSGFNDFIYLANDDGVYTGTRIGQSANDYLDLINDVLSWTTSGSVAPANNTAFAIGVLASCLAPSAVATPVFDTPTDTRLSAVFPLVRRADGFLVLRTTSAGAPTMVNGISYTAANAPGGSSFVSDDRAAKIIATGLAASTQYYFHVYAYESKGCTSGPVYSAATSSSTSTLAAFTNLLEDDFDATSTLAFNKSSGVSFNSGNTSNPSGNSFGVTGNGAVINNDEDTLTTCVYSLSTPSNFEFRLASLSGVTNNGADGADFVRVEVSLNGGTTYTQVVEVLGNTNAQWLYTAVNTATTAYSSPIAVIPAAGGDRTSTDGVGRVELLAIPAGDIKIRIILANDSPDEYWAVDDVKLSTSVGTSFTLKPDKVSNEGITTTFNSSTLMWENPDCLSNIVVIAKESSAPTFDPLNNNCNGTNGDCVASDLVANSTFGTVAANANLPTGEYCVYNGTGESVIVTGLALTTRYHYEIFTYLNPWNSKTDAPNLTIFTLPVDLVYFNYATTKDEVKLLWQTASELNNSHFEIYKSTDAITFEKIGEVTGMGTTSEQTDYSFKDTEFLTKQYYKLKQVDFDGRYEYSEVIFVEKEDDLLNVVRQTRDELIFAPSELVNVTITNMKGEVLLDTEMNTQMKISNQDYLPGIYIVRVQSLRGTQILKWMNI